MGNGPSKPSEEQMEELLGLTPQLCRGAAAAVAQADVLLVMTGAGWSADSGLAVYADVASFPAYAARGLVYRDLCLPQVLHTDPGTFYGWWGACFNSYRLDHQPHEGYAIVQTWRDTFFSGSAAAEEVRAHAEAAHAALGHRAPDAARPGAFFSFTSNVDAHWARFCNGEELRECHGNADWWQCADVACAARWPSASQPGPGIQGDTTARGERAWASTAEGDGPGRQGGNTAGEKRAWDSTAAEDGELASDNTAGGVLDGLREQATELDEGLGEPFAAGAMPEGVRPEGAVPEREIQKGAVPEGAVPKGPVPKGATPDGVMPEGEMPEGIIRGPPRWRVIPEGIIPEGVNPEGVIPGPARWRAPDGFRFNVNQQTMLAPPGPPQSTGVSLVAVLLVFI